MQHIRRTVSSLVLALAFGASANLMAAPTLVPATYEDLLAQAERKQYVRVMVNLDIDVPLSRATDKKLKREINALADKVLEELGSHALKTTVWNNGLGQIGVHVTPAGLAVLAQSSHIRGFDRDVTDSMRRSAYDSDGRLARIEEEIERSGYADVELALNLENFEYEIGPGGRAIFKTSAAQRAETATKLPALLASLPANGVPGLALAQANAAKDDNPGPTHILRINKEGVYVLKEHKDIRSLRLAGENEDSAPYLDPEALMEAKEHGSALVLVDLRRVAGYTSRLGSMPAKARRAQIDSIRKTFADIALGIEGAVPTQEFPGIASAAFHTPLRALERLYLNPDSRIKGVYLDKPIVVPALNQSTALMNMPQAWGKGYTATGQSIAILDTGIEKDHPFLQDAAGNSRVIYEACFGTKDPSNNIDTLCPNADPIGGDSPLGLAGSANPNCTFDVDGQCFHGTHVAGIAAGKRNWNNLTGVAPNASIIAVKVFSKLTQSNKLKAYVQDYTAALQAILNSGATEITANMSIASDSVFGGGCARAGDAIYDVVEDLIDRRVPVVAATGNNSERSGVSFPACVKNVVKVAAVNDTTGVFSTYSNVGDPTNYPTDNPNNAIPFFLAPGDMITSATLNYGTATASGTSMAAPHIAGLYAAIKSAVPGISVADATNWIAANGIGVTVPTYFKDVIIKRVRVPNI